MAPRRATWADASGTAHPVSFDQGVHHFTAVRPRFRAAITRVAVASCVVWRQPIRHAPRSPETNRCFVSTPSMPALRRHLLAGASLHLNATVRGLHSAADDPWCGATEGAPLAGPLRPVVAGLPPEQAAMLLAGHQNGWAETLMARRTEPCWKLMAVTDDIDWPWDAAELDSTAFAWMSLNDRVPGRAIGPGVAVWTAHATAEWSAAHLEAEPNAVRDRCAWRYRAGCLTPMSRRSRYGDIAPTCNAGVTPAPRLMELADSTLSATSTATGPCGTSRTGSATAGTGWAAVAWKRPGIAATIWPTTWPPRPNEWCLPRLPNQYPPSVFPADHNPLTVESADQSAGDHEPPSHSCSVHAELIHRQKESHARHYRYRSLGRQFQDTRRRTHRCEARRHP